MKIKAIAAWFGGKRTLAPKVVDLLGSHKSYFEAFCGSMAVLMAKHPAPLEHVNDLHGDLVNLARVLADESLAIKLYDRLSGVLFCEALVKDSIAFLSDPVHSLDLQTVKENPDQLFLDRAYHYFLASWMVRNGTAGTSRMNYQIAVRWNRRGGSSSTRFHNSVQSIPAWHVRLKNATITCRNAFSILEKFEDSEETAIYCDPPYADETRGKGSKDKGKHNYLHEFAHQPSLLAPEDDHTKLARILKSYQKAKIVVSYYDCPRIRRLYDGWKFYPFAMKKKLARQNKPNIDIPDAPEILITNKD